MVYLLKRTFKQSTGRMFLCRMSPTNVSFIMGSEIFSWLKQNWQTLSSLVSPLIAVLAFALSYKRFKRDTRPALIWGHGSEGTEIENVGPVAAVDITLTLFERTKRSSGRLRVGDTLRPGEKSTIRALDWPEALTVEMRQHVLEPMDHFVLRMARKEVRQDANRVASHLLCRKGKRIVILKFRAADRPNVFTRVFLLGSKQEAFTKFRQPCQILSNRLCAFLLERWYAKNVELAPPLRPFKYPVPSEGSTKPDLKNRLGR